MRFFAIIGLCLFAIVCSFSMGAPAIAQDTARAEVCVPYAGGDLVVRRGSQAVPVTIDDFLAPGDPAEALCCGSCVQTPDGPECTGCVNMGTFSQCFGTILACPEGEILTDDGGGGCA